MEQARVVIAIVLSFLVFFLWNIFFVEKKPMDDSSKETVEQREERRDSERKEPSVLPEEQDKVKVPYSATDTDRETKAFARVINIHTPLYSVAVDEKGAVFKSFILKDFKESVEENAAYKELIDPGTGDGMLRIDFSGKSISGLENAVFSSHEKGDDIQIRDEKREIIFSWVSRGGILVEKKYQFVPSTYTIGLTVVVKNGSERAIVDKAEIGIKNRFEGKKRSYSFEGPSALLNDNLEQIKPKKIKEKSDYKGKFKWIAIEDRYFIRSVIPLEQAEGVMRLSLDDNGVLSSQLISPQETIQPGSQKTYEYKVFLGPKSMKVLSDVDYDLKKALHFGMFDFIAKPCLWFMNFIYSRIPNYGVAIIILTVLTKLLLWPLGSKSYKSMSEMKRIQPLMAEIREKYKHDKKQMNQEVMALYRTYKVNPMGGCLPMVLQIPVFFALYRMLYSAIELRHAPFFLWIKDLSAPERLFHFGFSIPLMQPPAGIPVLTVIMGATMLLQQRMSPPPGDPTQAKMMMLMPIVFMVIFINFSSGLVLYWLVNNILSIIQQTYIQKKYA